MKIHGSLVSLVITLSIVALFSACATTPAPIPENLAPAELIQNAQSAADRGDYDNSVRYYKTILDRYPDNATAVCAAEYEIAFIQYKRKNFADAKTRFKALLARYADSDAALLPTEYKVLSDKLLIDIELTGK